MTAAVSPAVIPVAGSAAVRPLSAGDALRLYGATSGFIRGEYVNLFSSEVSVYNSIFACTESANIAASSEWNP